LIREIYPELLIEKIEQLIDSIAGEKQALWSQNPTFEEALALSSSYNPLLYLLDSEFEVLEGLPRFSKDKGKFLSSLSQTIEQGDRAELILKEAM